MIGHKRPHSAVVPATNSVTRRMECVELACPALARRNKILLMVNRDTLWVRLCALGAILFGRLLAADYYVAATGDDAAAGASPGTAWRSVNKVNAMSFKPGDRICFQGGQEFRGNLRLGHGSGGRVNKPVVITSFGGGRATLLAGHDTGITVESAGFVTISNLAVVGDGPTNNTGYGILCDNRLDEFRRLENLHIENVDASGFGVFGILVSGKRAGYHHVRVIGCDLHDNLRGGMEIAGRLPWDSPLYAHSDVVVRRCRAHDNSGDPDYTKNHSGSGMVLYQVEGGVIEDCRAWANGQQCHHGNGGVGIWSCASRGVVIQHCESFANRTSGGDGGGFDLDGGSIDCVLQYNYSHDNDGPGLMAYTYAYASHADRGNTIRFNISDQDSRKGERYAGLWVRSDGGAMTGLKIYNNTVRMGRGGKQAAYVNGRAIEAELRSNIFVGCDGTLPLVVEQPEDNLRFENNLYWGGGAPLRIRWGETNFGALDEWRQSTGQELVDGKAVGFFADPKFALEPAPQSAGDGDWHVRLSAYKPRFAAAEWLSAPIPVARSWQSGSFRDILGRPLTPNRWPLGAVGPGS